MHGGGINTFKHNLQSWDTINAWKLIVGAEQKRNAKLKTPNIQPGELLIRKQSINFN